MRQAGADGWDSDIVPAAEGQPGPRAEFVLRDEHGPPVTVGVGRHRQGGALQQPERIAAR